MQRFFSIAGVCLLALFMVVPPAIAQEPSSTTGTVQLRSQTPWVTAGQPFNFELGISTSLPPDQVDLVVTVSSALNNRSSFFQTLGNKVPGSPLIVERRPLTDVIDANNVVRMSFPVGDATQRRYYLRDSGVFPVKVELRETGSSKVIDQFTTHLINQTTTPPTDTRLQVATVFPVQTPASPDPEKTLGITDETDDAAGLAVLGAALSAQPSFPTNLSVAPESLEKLENSEGKTRDVISAFVAATKSAYVLRSTWAPIPAALYEGDLLREVDRQLERGDSAIDSQFTNRDQKTFMVTDTLDTGALSHLRDRGVERLVIPESVLATQQRDMTLARPFNISLGRGKPSLAAVQADNALSDRFATTDSPVLAAHQLLADLAVIWHDRPAQTREVVAMPKRDWVPNAAFLNALLPALETSPILQPITVDQAFRVTPEGATRNADGTFRNVASLKMAPIGKGPNASLSTSRIRDAREQMNGFGSMVEPNNTIKEDLERRLLYSQSTLFDAAQRGVQHDAFDSELDKQMERIHMPPNRSIQLTARQGEIPVSIQNDTGYPVTMRLTLESNQLDFPNGNSRDVTVGRQSITVPFAIDAKTSGAFPVQVKLESLDGSLTIVSSRIVVRSTSASGIGIGLSIGAGLFLVLWWARSLWKSRRKPRSS